MSKAHEVLAGVGLLPREMPASYTNERAREVLASLEGYAEAELLAAAEAAKGLGVRGPLAVAVFALHHLRGAHEVEVDRVAEHEGTGERFTVLVYAEGEVPVRLDALIGGVGAGQRLRYDPAARAYRPPKVVPGRIRR